MDAIGRLAGGIAHDFNNLLTAILGYAEILESRGVLGGGPAPGGDLRGGAAIGYVREIRKAADRAASLTRQLLAFSRKQRLEPKLVDVNALIEGTCAMLRRLIGENIELSTELEPACAPVKADPGQIEQVIMNLALNARDAMPDGGTLAIRTANASPGRAVRGFVLLEIEDTGCGMDDEARKHLFEPFYTTKGPGKGTGLGLATVYGIVKQSRGFIFVSSQKGKGTTFRIYFPRGSTQKEDASDGAAGSSTPYGRETILLVDGDDGARGVLAECLKGFGYTVLTAAGAHDAVELAGDDGKLQVDLILARQASPAVNEPGHMKELASRFAGTKVLLISGTTDEDYAPHVLVTKMREILDGQAPAA
jgi:CheY-like chemotaxis protein